MATDGAAAAAAGDGEVTHTKVPERKKEPTYCIYKEL